MDKYNHEHNDPIRFPLLQFPIEDKVIKLHNIAMSKMLVDITKQMVNLKKSK